MVVRRGKVWVVVALLSPGGFAIVDGSDPANPVLVSKRTTGGYGADVKMSDDTNTVYMSLQGNGAACNLGLLPVMVPLPQPVTCGVQVFDTLDKANPAFVASLITSTAGSHMMDVEVFNGVPTLAMAAQGTPSAVPIALAPAGRVPVTVGRANTGFVHDVTLRPDPLDGGPRAFVANWNDGVRIYDLTVPAVPDEIGQFDVDPATDGGHVHTVMPFALAGRRLLAAQQETFNQNVLSKVWVLDASDLASIGTLGIWTNPDGRTTATGSFRWSTHNLHVADGKLYLAHYHGGMVVLDVGDPGKLGAPPMLANFVPAGPKVGGGDAPMVWEAMPHGDVVWVTDIPTGLYAVRLA